MYVAVLMLAMTTGAESVEFGRRNNGCTGCYGCSSAYVGCSGCYGGCYGGYSSGCCSSSGYSRAGYGSYYAPTQYYASGSYYAPRVVVQPQTTNVRQSFYYDPASSATSVRIMVPNPDAEIWFDNAPTMLRGTERLFYAPAGSTGRETYTVKARWNEGGQIVNRERRVELQPGQSVMVDFRTENGEKLAVPKN